MSLPFPTSFSVDVIVVLMANFTKITSKNTGENVLKGER
jgi:hypothetical protein